MSGHFEIEKTDTDILVVGGGIAGTIAAVTAADAGARTVILERANTYRSGCAGSGIDHLTSYVPPVHEKVGYTRQMMKDEMAEGLIGAGLGDRRIADHFVDVCYERIMGLEQYGIQLRYEDAHLPGGFRLVPQFQNVPTSINFDGRDLKVKLTEAAKKAGAKIINHAMTVSILTDEEGNARGAVAVSSRKNVIYVVTAKAVILSVGNGVERLARPCNKEDRHYERPSASGNGSCVSLPLSAGAEVANLEFNFSEGELSFMGFSTRVGSPGSSWWPAARAVDDDGQVVVKRIYDFHIDEPDYVKRHTKMWQDFMNEFRSMHGYLRNGRQLYMDFDEATDEELAYIKWTLGNEGRCWLWVQNLDRAGINLRDVKIPYKYEHKVTMSGPCVGTVVNEKTETTVKGLYAAGDSMGLTLGSGPFAVVFGIEAGQNAAEFVRKVDESEYQKIPVREEAIENTIRLAEHFSSNEKGEPWQNYEMAVRGIVNTFGTSPLTDRKIRYGLDKLAEIRDNLNIYAKNPHEMARAFQIPALLDAAEGTFEAASNRQSGFGPYKRVRNFRDWETAKDQPDPPSTVAYTTRRDADGTYHFREYHFSGENQAGNP